MVPPSTDFGTIMPIYQIKHNNYRWDDRAMDITSLNNLARMISASPMELEGTLLNDDLPNLIAYIKDYHGCAPVVQTQGSHIFDIIDFDIDVESFDHDVLKISYHFTVRYNDQSMRKINGKLALMEKPELDDSHGALFALL
jgi:hypothetical protein